MNPRHSQSPIRTVILVLLACITTACATTPAPMLTEDVGSIRAGVTAARQEASDSFISANELTRQQGIDRKIRLPEKILRPEDFPVAVPATAAAQWDNAFGILDQYAAALQSLVDEQRARETGDAIGSLGQALNDSSVLQSKIPGALTAVFSEFGQALVQARAERKATEVMRATDPAFRHVVDSMAAAIGEPAQPGSLANTVEVQWDSSVLPLLENDYALVPASDMDQRRQVLDAYTQAMASRDKQLNDLSQLQRSLVALGEAHSAAARGRPGDALFWIGRINTWADDIRTRMKPAEEANQ